MFKVIIYSYYYYFVKYNLIKINIIKQDTLNYIVYHSLYNNVSYRLPQNSAKDFLIVLKQYKRLFLLLWKKHEQFTNEENKSNSIIIDADSSSFETRKEYLSIFFKNNYFTSASNNNINDVSYSIKIILQLILTIQLPFSFLFSIFQKNKRISGLKIVQFTECIVALSKCKKNNIKEAYYFCLFEPNSNLNSYILQKFNINVNFITSEVPLRFGNTKMYANTIHFCFAYQLNELEHYKKTIIAQNFNLLIPETCYKNIEYYKQQNLFETPKNTIGFISSGMWLRKILGDADSGLNELENEKIILQWLLEYISNNADVTLIVYLHPLERNTIHFEKTKEHYFTLFGNKIDFAPLNIPSSKGFHYTDICVSLYSTLIYERLFMGFKSILVPLGISEFPLKNSILDKTSAKTKNELYNLLNKFLKITTEDYLNTIGLSDYTYKSILKNIA